MAILPKIKEGFTLDDAKLTVAAAKLGSVWGLIGVTNWAEAGQAVAVIYGVLMIVHFVWRHFLRPFAEWAGWMTPKSRRWVKVEKTDFQDPI